MADVQPFRGWRYNAAVVPDLSLAIAPPYDVISPSLQQKLHRQSPYNVVRLELGQPRPTDNEMDNVYTRAARLLRQWQAEGVLAREAAPAFYLVEEAFQLEGAQRTRLALYGAVTLESWARGVILPHEETTAGPKADRLRLLEACGANISPVLALYQDVGGLGALLGEQTRSQPPLVDRFSAAGVAYRLWVLQDPLVLQRIQQALRPAQLYIADGHHRYETALAYRDLAGAARPGAAQVLIGLVSMQDPGLEVQSFHRLLSRLAPPQVEVLRQRMDQLFEMEPVAPGRPPGHVAGELAARLEANGEGACVFGLLEDGGRVGRLLRLKPDARLSAAAVPELQKCEAWVLHRALLEPALGSDALSHLDFAHGANEVAQALERGEAQMVFLVRAIPLGLFRRLVAQGQRLPPKTTYFYPKLPTGIVLRALDETP